MKNDSLALFLLGTVALASCGGDTKSSGPIAGTPTPTPSPTPTPAPTPAPTPVSYTRFSDLTGNRTFNTACDAVAPQGMGTPGQYGSADFLTSQLISYAAANETWTIKPPGSSFQREFGLGERGSSTAQLTQWKRPSPRSGNSDQRFDLYAASPSNVPVLDYSRAAQFALQDDSGFPVFGMCVFGVPTNNTDVPKTSTVVWGQLLVGGIVFDQRSGGGTDVSVITGGSGNLSGNVATGKIDISFAYDKRAPDSSTSRVSVSGQVAYSESGSLAGYTGVINQSAFPDYRINGAFFGPQGTETGFTFVAFRDEDRNGIYEQTVLGFVSAKK